MSANSAMRSSLGVEVAALRALVVHPACEPVCEQRARQEYAAENGNRDERVGEAFHSSE